MKVRFAKVQLTDGSRPFFLRVTRETDALICGWEVDREGDEIVPRGFERRLRLVQKTLISRLTWYRMNNTYATLEEEQ